MQKIKKNERGSVMVEAIAVIALLGIMGTLLYRQVKNRNDELDNINMASEIRTIKDATAAYIQADYAALNSDCESIDGELADYDAINNFLPFHWQGDGILDYYDILLTCSSIDDTLAPGRNSIYATIIPKEGTLPSQFNLKRAARVANLIGSDGGIHIDTENTLHGTMGAWEVDCPARSCRDGNYFVATTGMDIYIPETDSPDNTVSVPKDIAFRELHGARYFSVGDGSNNCISNMQEGGRYAHEIKPADHEYAQDDAISRVGSDDCNPLFWVGVKKGTNDRSNSNHVYVKNNLYIGRNNTNANQAVAIETDNSDNTKRQISVYDTDGKARLILNANGQIIGRREENGTGYRLDPENGEIVLFKEYSIGSNRVQIPTLRLLNNRIETNVRAEYYENTTDESTTKANYAVDPANTSLMNDIRLISRGGAKLSEILPDYIAKGIESFTVNSEDPHAVSKPSCPKGYVRAITVTPIQSTQAVTEAKLKVNIPAGSAINTEIETIPSSSYGTISANGDNVSLSLTQHEPVQISITGNETSVDSWSVSLTYNGTPPTSLEPITALVHTYCVYNAENFDSDSTATTIINSSALNQEAGTKATSKTRGCTTDADCDASETCQDDRYCVMRPTCNKETETKIGTNLYCVEGMQVYLECFTDNDCHGKTCDTTNYRCKDKTEETS